MRRSVKWTIAVAIVAAMFAGVYRWPMASARVRVELNRATPSIGLHWRGPERVNFALLPWPTLRVIGVDLIGADGRNVLSAPEARFPLSILALMRGRLMPVGVTLESPTALIDLDAAPALAAERAVADDTGDNSGAWAQMRVRGGVLHIVSASHGVDTLVESLAGGLDWPRTDAPLQFSLIGAWREERVDIRGSLDNPSAALRRRATPVAFKINSRPLALQADGVWGGDDATRFAGRLSAEIRSLSGLKRLLGGDGAPFPLGDSSRSPEGAGDRRNLDAERRSGDGVWPDVRRRADLCPRGRALFRLRHACR